MVLRGVLLTVGVVLAAVGLVDLLDDGWADLGHTVVWLGAGVVAHDAVLSIAVIVVGAVVVTRLPSYARAPVIVGLVVLGSVTLAVAPTLLGVGAVPDNPSLLDRPYGSGWVVFAGTVLLAVTFAVAVARRRTKPRESETAE